MPYIPYKTIQNVAVAHILDGAENIPVKVLEVGITPKQAGTGSPSPDNIRAISAWEEGNIFVSSIPDESDETYTVDWSEGIEKIYGGRYNALTGNLMITHAFYQFTGTENFTKSTIPQPDGYSRYDVLISGTGNRGADATAIISSHFPTATSANKPGCYLDSGSGPNALAARFTVPTENFADAAAFKEFIKDQADAETPVQICWELMVPVSNSISPIEVKTLLGENYIWADTGKIIKLVYPVDIREYYRRFFMLNSGYILLDGGMIDLSTDQAQTITGSWNRIVTAMNSGKPIWAYNTTYGDAKPLTPVPVFAWYLSEDSIVIVGATLHIIVSDDDTCVVQDVS